MKARETVTEEPEILGGIPVIKGSRVAVYDIAAAFDAGTPVDGILKSYPSLKDWQVELASVYAKAVPLKGRPKRNVLSGLTEKSVIKKRLRRSSIGAQTSHEVSDR